MPAPSIVLGFILATIYGAVFHTLFGGELRRLALFLLASWLGFALGQFFGVASGLRIAAIGQVNIVAATLGAWLALFATHFLTNVPRRQE